MSYDDEVMRALLTRRRDTLTALEGKARVEDDWRDTQRHYSEAARNAYGHPHADLHTLSGVDQAELADDERIPTRPTPITIQRATIGRSATVSSGQIVSIIQWNGRKDETQSLTIDFARGAANSQGTTWPTGLDSTGKTYSYLPFALVRAGSDGFTWPVQVQLDIGRGTRITLAASYCEVLVGMDSPPIVPSGHYAAGSMLLGAQIGFYSATSLAPVTRTLVGYLAPAGTQTFTIPERANFLLPVQESDALGVTTLEVQDAGGTTITALTFAAGGMIAPLPLPDDAYQVKVTNAGGNAAYYRLPFQLAL